MAITKSTLAFTGLTATEVAYLDDVTPGTAIASKAVVLDSGGDFILLDDHVWNFGTGSDVQMRWDGTDMDILAAANNSIIKWGNGTNSFDQWWFGSSSALYISWDASANDLKMEDSVSLMFGTGAGAGPGTAGDVEIRWDGTDLDVLGAANNLVIKWGNGTNSFDMWWYGATASDRIVFDASANLVDFDGVDLQLKDADILHFGDTIADDARIVFDGTRLVITPLTIGGPIHIGDAADTVGNQVHIFDGGADDPGLIVMYDAAGVAWFLWVDTTGDLRVHSAAPTNEDGDGTVVGAQS